MFILEEQHLSTMAAMANTMFHLKLINSLMGHLAKNQAALELPHYDAWDLMLQKNEDFKCCLASLNKCAV